MFGSSNSSTARTFPLLYPSAKNRRTRALLSSVDIEIAPFCGCSLRKSVSSLLEWGSNSIHSENDARLHFFATHCQGQVLAGLPWRRDHTELLQQAKSVTIDPLFDGLAVYNTVNENPRPAHLLASRW